MKFFNTAGPIKPDIHYFVSQRFDMEQLDSLIAMQKYFILHAPRQTGKTSLIMEYVKALNAAGKYRLCCLALKRQAQTGMIC